MIRFAQDNPRDALAARKIWAEVFGDPPAYLDWYFSRVYRAEDTLLCEEGGELAAHLQMRVVELVMRGNIAKAGYLAGVATYPQFRGRGYASALVRRAFDELRARGVDYCFLVPTTFEFYERLGFATCYDKRVRTVPSEALPEPSGVLWENIENENKWAYLDPAYACTLRDCNGYVWRSEREWTLFLQDNLYNNRAECRFVDEDGHYGYYIAKKDIKESCLRVTEYGCSSAKVYGAMLRQLARLASGCDKTEMIIPYDDGKALGEIKTQPYAMGRVLNAENALRLCAREFDGSVCIGITDGEIAENNSVFNVQNCSVRRGGTPDIKMSVQTLAALTWGYISLCDAEIFETTPGAAAKAEGMFPPQKNYLDNAVFAF